MEFFDLKRLDEDEEYNLFYYFMFLLIAFMWIITDIVH